MADAGGGSQLPLYVRWNGPSQGHLSITGVFYISSDQNGNTIVRVTGRGVAEDPSFGLVLLVGEFTLVFDPQGNIISGPTGNGQIINICQLIN